MEEIDFKGPVSSRKTKRSALKLYHDELHTNNFLISKILYLLWLKERRSVEMFDSDSYLISLALFCWRNEEVYVNMMLVIPGLFKKNGIGALVCFGLSELIFQFLDDGVFKLL